MPVSAVVLVLTEGDLALEGADLSPEEQLDTQMGPASSYEAGPLGSGEPLAFQVVSRAAGPPVAQPAESSNGLGLGIAAGAAAAVAVYLMWRPPAPSPMPQDVRAQVKAIAVLDREFESGLITEAQYRQKRASLKRHLIDELAG